MNTEKNTAQISEKSISNLAKNLNVLISCDSKVVFFQLYKFYHIAKPIFKE